MRKLSGVLFVVALALVACGGGSDNTSTNASASDSTAVTAAKSSGTFTDFCGARAAFDAGANGAAPDVNTMKQAYKNIDKAASYAPTEIKADVRTVVDAAKPLFSILASVDFDYMKAANDPKFQAAASKMQDEKVKAASDRVDAWVTAHCK